MVFELDVRVVVGRELPILILIGQTLPVLLRRFLQELLVDVRVALYRVLDDEPSDPGFVVPGVPHDRVDDGHLDLLVRCYNDSLQVGVIAVGEVVASELSGILLNYMSRVSLKYRLVGFLRRRTSNWCRHPFICSCTKSDSV